ncbi:MAG TPA: flagellar hook-associated protein 3 [Planctomycetes bacterium]|nr:flagellar hook-associated protein 3 [Planctomycetota bacterium]
MVLRITQNILLNNALRDITRNALSLNEYREKLSTGKELNRPSDDPAAFLRILPLRNDIESVKRYQQNAILARDILNTSSSGFQDAADIMAEARKLAVQGANGTLSQSDRDTLASQVNQLLKQMVGIANSRLGDRYLFGGAKTSTQAFTLTDNENATFVKYNGDDQGVSLSVAPGVEVAVHTPGDKLFMKTNRSGLTFTGNTGVKGGTGASSGRGQAFLEISHTGFSNLPTGVSAGSTASTALGNLSYTITMGPPNTITVGGGTAVTFDASSSDLEIKTSNGDSVYLDMSAYAGSSTSGTLTSNGRMTWDGGGTYTSIDFSSTNLHVKNDTKGEILAVDATGILRTGKEMVSFEGTYDAFNSLIALRDLLQNKGGLTSGDQAKQLTALIGELDKVGELVLESLRDLGARSANLDTTKDRMGRLELSMDEALSRDEDVDLSAVILKMTQRDTSYQASLAVGARVISTSLLDFLR